MSYQVIAAFIDRRSGKRIEAGDALPEGLDRATIQRLVRARCLEPVDAGDLLPPTPPGAGAAASLFPEDGDGVVEDGEDEPEPAPRRGRKSQAAQ
jgi:hypothetical protein